MASASPMTGEKRQRSIADMFGLKKSTSDPSSNNVKKNQKIDSAKAAKSSKTSSKGSSLKLNGSLPRVSYQKISNVDQESIKKSLSSEFKKLLELELDSEHGLGSSYLSVLRQQLTQQYFLNLKRFLIDQGLGQPKCDIYPPQKNIYVWSRVTPLDKIKVVIIGQDPYHGPGQAHGLCFSVPRGIPIPGSLRNIHEELKREYPDFKKPTHGSLVSWAQSGVLLLNTSLTVKKSEAGSHSNRGWEQFTDSIVEAIDLYGGLELLNERKENEELEGEKRCEDEQGRSEKRQERLSDDDDEKVRSEKKADGPGFGNGVVFLCWGKWAADRVANLSTTKHLILKSAHPSPLSAHRGFLGNGHFKRANEWLESKYGSQAKVDWCTLKPELS
ncbi:uracil-DNA glycosylase-like protein [Phakopsora pachyrhizi]|nr:uracil-DNA glycosylase-like protein [Phakopsora pachyrhizi]